MTATRGIGRWATLVVLSFAWLAGAWFLWRTSVPTNLDLGALDVHRFFSAHELKRAADYQRFLDVLWLLETVATVVALAVLAHRAPRIVRTLGLGRVGAGVIIAMLILVTLWFVSLPFGFAAQWWQARHGLAPHDYVSWIFAPWAVLAFEALYALVFVLIVLGLAGWLGDRWWLVGGPVFVALAALFVFLSGWLFQFGTHGVRSARLQADIRVLEKREGVPGTPVHVQDVSNVTKQANAYSSGFGPSANVILWNTLLDGRFSPGEVRVVVGHELGHVAHRHTLKGIGWSALTVLPIAWLVTVIARRRGGIQDPGVLPFALLTLVVLNVVTAPLINAITRRYEAEADWSALKATHDPRSARRLFIDFEKTSLQEPSPSLLDYLWLENHPTIAQRIAMAEAWAKRNPR
jgi:Zn-dependent protease with chaperone function